MPNFSYLNAGSVFLYSLCSVNMVFGQLTPTNMQSSLKTTSEIEKMEPLNPKAFDKEKPAAKDKTKAQGASPFLTPATLPKKSPQMAHYFHPGVLALLNGRWEGSDNLLNLSNQIGVYVKIFKPQTDQPDISEEQIQKLVEGIFQEKNIQPVTMAVEGQAPLPAFEIALFLYPIPTAKGYAVFCSGRLFESVKLNRLVLDPNTDFQAITWEKQQLIVTPSHQLSEQVAKSIQEIARTFTERFQSSQSR